MVKLLALTEKLLIARNKISFEREVLSANAGQALKKARLFGVFIL
jgi:hypothetical protein